MKIAKITHAAFNHGEKMGIRFCLITGETAEKEGDVIAESLFNYYNNPNSPYNRRADGEDVKDKDIEEVGREGKCYTMSVGDIVKMEDENKAWKCTAMGWEQVEV